MTDRDTDPVQVPRWAFRLAGGTILMGMVAFFTISALFTVWLVLLTWGIAAFSNESRTDRQSLHSEVEVIREATERIEQGTKAVEKAMTPDGAKQP